MKFNYNDGGRSKYFKGQAGDCVTRAIAIATGMDYKEVYNLVAKKVEAITGTKSARNGVPKKLTKQIMKELGFKWVSTMSVGTGCKVHLREEDLPEGIIITKVTGHIVCIIDGVINDTYDCSRDGNRCVYGYWYKEDYDEKR